MQSESQFNKNFGLAAKLIEYASLLSQQKADGFRVRAYRHTTLELEHLDRPVRQIFSARGRNGLMEIEGVGRAIAGAIAEMLATGNWSRPSRLRGAWGHMPDPRFHAAKR